MSLFGKETARLVRTRWRPEQIHEFAEEVYALLNGRLPMTISAPVTIAPEDGSTPLTINFPDAGTGPAITINNGGVEQTIGGTTIGGNQVGGVTFNPPSTGPTPTNNGGGGGGGSGIDLGDIEFPDEPPADAVPPPTQNPFTLYGEVQAKISGNTYSVKLWARDPYTAPPIATIAVRFPYVNADDVIPTNTPCPVICYPGLNATNGLAIARAISFVPMFLPAS